MGVHFKLYFLGKNVCNIHASFHVMN